MARRYGRNNAKKGTSKPKISRPRKNKPGQGRVSDYTEEQINALLSWIAEGMTGGEINNAAANFTPAFHISDQLIYHYRKTRELDIEKLREDKEFVALRTGLAVKTNRVKALMRLAARLEEDIEVKKKLWLKRQRSFLTSPKEYKVVTEEEFIAPLVKELRGIYDDIAKETGGRILKADITSKGKQIKGYVGISPEDWDKMQSTEEGNG